MVHPAWPKRTIFQLGLYGRCQAQAIVNIHHFEASATEEATFVVDDVAQASGQALVDDWVANLKTAWLACHTQDYTLERVTGQVIERPGQINHKLAAHESILAAANVGTINADADDMTTCVVVRWRTPNAGKSHRGRTYIGPLSEGSSVAGHTYNFIPGAFGDYATAMLARYKVLSGTSADRWIMTVYSRPYSTGEYQYATRKTGTLTVVTPPDYAGNSTNITAAFTDTTLRVQRRRELGVGG